MPLKSFLMPHSSRYHAIAGIVAVTGLLTALLGNPAFADDVSDVSKLLQNGQHAQALNKADAILSRRPGDPQMRFLKGVILTEQNKAAEAIAIFTRLTEDFPDLPEPHNNLAVLYAADGQFEKARAALDRAIRTNPAYATAYENLGDVHAKLASQAYDKALQLDSRNSGAKSKLTLVRNLVETSGGEKVAAATRAEKAVTPAAQVPSTASAASGKTAVAAPPPAKTKSSPIVAADTEPKKDAKPASAPTADSNAERTAVLNVVNGWAKAWSAQDVKTYLSYYSNDFATPNGMSRKAWINERRSRISGKGRIKVQVISPQVTVNGNTATVKFRQNYVSDRLTANSLKTLDFTKTGGKWQIKQERTGS
jgi:tetratricopeptide (TPR) repeat protein